MEPSLLDYLQVKIKCEYLSDLPQYRYRQNIISELELIPFSSYPLDAWIHATQYITKAKGTVKTKNDVLLCLKAE